MLRGYVTGAVRHRRTPPTPRLKPMLYGLPEEKAPETTIRVRMNKTTKALPFGGSPEVTYAEGEDYDLPEWLAEAFFRGGEADPAEAHQVAEAAEQTHADPVTTPRRRAKK